MLRRLAKDTAIYGLSDFVFRFISFAIFPIYAHVFTVADFGKLELLASLAGLASLLINPGLNNSTQRFYWDAGTHEDDRPQIVSSGIWMLTVWATVTTIAMLIGLNFFADFIVPKYELAWILVVLALVNNVPAQIIQYCMDVLRLHFAPWRFTVLSALRNLLVVLLSLLLVIVFRQGLAGFFVGSLIAMILTVPFAFWFIQRDLQFKVDYRFCKILFKFGYPFIFAGMAYWVFGSLDRWMLGTMTDTTQVGLFSIAYKLASVVVFVNAAFGQAWSPFAIKIYAEEPNYRAMYSQIFSYWFFGLAMLGTMISLFSIELLRLLTPPPYWPAANIVSFTVMGVVLFGTTQITALGISLEKQTHFLSTCAWVTALVNFLLNLLLIPYFGALGSAIATFGAYLSLTGIYLYLTQRLHPIPWDKPRLLFSLIIVILTLLASLILNSQPWSLWISGIKCLLVLIIFVSACFVRLIPVVLLKNLIWEDDRGNEQ